MSRSQITRVSQVAKSTKMPVKPAVVERPGRRDRRAAQTKAKLFRCAIRLIARRGIDKVTVEDITEAADVGKGTFFNYFKTKEQVLGMIAEIQLEHIREAAALGEQGKRPIRAVLQRLTLSLAEDAGKTPPIARAYLSAFHASKESREMNLNSMREGKKTIAGLIDLGQQRREVDRKLKKDQLATHLLQTILGTVMLWSIEERPALRRAASKSFDHFWKSIAAPGRARKR